MLNNPKEWLKNNYPKDIDEDCQEIEPSHKKQKITKGDTLKRRHLSRGNVSSDLTDLKVIVNIPNVCNTL